MIQSTKSGQYWSFWCQGGCNNQDQAVFLGKRALEVIELAEAAEVIEAVKVSKAVNIITEIFRVLGFDNSKI